MKATMRTQPKRARYPPTQQQTTDDDDDDNNNASMGTQPIHMAWPDLS